jgi:hypothetical protein
MSPTLIAGLLALIVFSGGGFYINVLRSEVKAERVARIHAEDAGKLCSDNTRILAAGGEEEIPHAEKKQNADRSRS